MDKISCETKKLLILWPGLSFLQKERVHGQNTCFVFEITVVKNNHAAEILKINFRDQTVANLLHTHGIQALEAPVYSASYPRPERS